MEGTPRGLAGWYAEPLTPREAQNLLERAADRQRSYIRHGRPCRCCGLLELIGRFFAGQPHEPLYHNLARRLRHAPHGSALLELIYGQLLMSRRIEGAMDHLERGFALSGGLFASADYFTVLERHRRLRFLPLTPTPQTPDSLAGLLATAAVVERLGGKPKPPPHDPTDLYG